MAKFLKWIDQAFPPDPKKLVAQETLQFQALDFVFSSQVCVSRNYVKPNDLLKEGPVVVRPWQLP